MLTFTQALNIGIVFGTSIAANMEIRDNDASDQVRAIAAAAEFYTFIAMGLHLGKQILFGQGVLGGGAAVTVGGLMTAVYSPMTTIPGLALIGCGVAEALETSCDGDDNRHAIRSRN